MRRVERLSFWKSLFSGFRHGDDLPEGPWLIVNRHLFKPLTLTAGLLLVLGITSAFSRSSEVLFIATLGLVIYRFTVLRSIVSGLHVKRRLKQTSCTEGDTIEVAIEVFNTSGFAIRGGLLIEDEFSGCNETFISLGQGVELESGRKALLTYKRVCDGGMGAHPFGVLRARVRDPLGIFEYCVSEDESHVVDVYPRIVPLPDLPVLGSASSPSIGSYELSSRGLSVNFSGIRPYAMGDSLRHVAWRVSAKQANLMVKEFERAVGCDISIVMNMDAYLHFGRQSLSTWEFVKDCALAVTSQQLANANSIQLLSNKIYIPSGRGAEHLAWFCNQLMNLQPEPDPSSVHRIGAAGSSLIERFDEWIPSESTVVYISVYDEAEFSSSFRAMGALKDRGVDVFWVYIDASSFLDESVGPTYSALFVKKAAADVDAAALKIRSAGMKAYVARKDPGLAAAFLPPKKRSRQVAV